LSVIKLEESYNALESYNQTHLEEFTREAMQVNGTEECEELDTMLREFGEIFVDHFQSAFKHIFHDSWHLILHERLR